MLINSFSISDSGVARQVNIQVTSVREEAPVRPKGQSLVQFIFL